MIDIGEIERVARCIGAEFRPERIVLFGSYATGQVTMDSDVDLLVILSFEGKNWHKAAEIRKRIHFSFPVDLVLRTPEQIKSRLDSQDPFICEITEKGRTLYAA